MLMGLPTRGYLSAAALRGMRCKCCTQKKQPPGRAGAYHVGRRWTRGVDLICLCLSDGRRRCSLGRPGSLAPARSRAIEDKSRGN